jgi:exodeoxyribonuclease VII large subunit
VSNPITVSALAGLLKSHVGEFFGNVTVVGEISNFTAHRSGHWYFAIKDQGAVINCAMFRGSNGRVQFRPASGDRVVLTGGMDMYAPQGRLNLIARTMSPDGAGDMAAKLEALKKKLAAEGLFDPSLKRPLPPMPVTIGVATSPTGAAFQDVLKVLRRRFPGRHVLLSPCTVQGDGAAQAVIDAIHRLEADGRAEVIIFGRGGGSPEDLMAFNDERLARVVAACSIPTVSAVGHEVDVSITDLVADVRAATPSHAAELVVPERDGVLAYVDELSERLTLGMRRQIERRQERLGHIKLRDPRQRVVDGRLRLDEMTDRLHLKMGGRMERERARLGQLSGRLDAMSPLKVLDRGYSVVTTSGRPVTSAKSLQAGDSVRLRFHDGERAATIEQDPVS